MYERVGNVLEPRLYVLVLLLKPEDELPVCPLYPLLGRVYTERDPLPDDDDAAPLVDRRMTEELFPDDVPEARVPTTRPLLDVDEPTVPAEPRRTPVAELLRTPELPAPARRSDCPEVLEATLREEDVLLPGTAREPYDRRVVKVL